MLMMTMMMLIADADDGGDDADDVDQGIPLICHGSHGYIRVNFFWPV